MSGSMSTMPPQGMQQQMGMGQMAGPSTQQMMLNLLGNQAPTGGVPQLVALAQQVRQMQAAQQPQQPQQSAGGGLLGIQPQGGAQGANRGGWANAWDTSPAGLQAQQYTGFHNGAYYQDGNPMFSVPGSTLSTPSSGPTPPQPDFGQTF